MILKPIDAFFMVWLLLMSLTALFAFAVDKWLAGRSRSRVSEATLLWFSALGGWIGGFLAMKLFRHKTAKGPFKLKFAATLLPCLAWLGLWWVWR